MEDMSSILGVRSDDSCVLPNEKTPLINQDAETPLIIPHTDIYVKSLKRRWYVLCLFSALGFIQGAVWNTWGPISLSAFKVFPQWDNSTIALLSNWGCITFVLFLLPMTWLRNKCGLRCVVLCTGFLLVFGTGIRCITLNGSLYTNFIHIGQFLNGIAGIIVNTAPLLVSAEWFPPNERTTSTAVSSVMTTGGVAFAFIIGPLIVDDSVNSDDKSIEHSKIEHNINLLMQIEFFATVAVVLCACIYFPSKPHRPPSISASVVRCVNLKESFFIIIKNKNLLLLTFTYALSTGVIGAWISIMSLILKVLNISQMKIGWLGFITETLGIIVAILVGRFADIFRKRMKCTILIGLALAAVSSILFMLIIHKLFNVPDTCIYAIVIVMGSLNIILCPLFFELASEIIYPVDENTTGALVCGGSNVVGGIFLLLFFIPNIGINWVNWALIFSALVSIPLMLGVKEVYLRSSVDDQLSV